MFRTAPGSRLAYLLFATLIALSLVAVALPRPAAAAVDASCEDTHTVKAGENIYSISKKYGITVSKLEKTNNLEKPYSLTVGQELCIPAVPKASSDYKWSAAYNSSSVFLDGTGFKKSHPFIVKARESDTSPWYKVGKAAADKNGVMDTTLKLPKELAKSASLKICLKDGVTDFLDCKFVYRQ